jgi:demethylmenaquinone methyltransferase/2-methoxy-6-polyprenyl-1,4-benzoquinol methylase
MTAGRASGLRTTIATPEGKRRYVRALFATIADRYDFITRFLSFGQDRRWKRRLVRLASITPADRVLDLACGTGDILFAAMRQHPRRAVGIDLTHRMLVLANARGRSELARRRSNPARGRSDLYGPTVTVIGGDMLVLPLKAQSFDVVTVGYGLRNVPHLHEAVREIHRVLTRGGRLLSLDFNRPSNAVVRSVYLAYLTVIGSALGLALHRDPDTYRYIPESIRNYPGAIGIARMLEAEGFGDVRIVPVLFGLMTIHVARKI